MNEKLLKLLKEYKIPVFVISDSEEDEEEDDVNELEMALRERWAKPKQKADRWMPNVT